MKTHFLSFVFLLFSLMLFSQENQKQNFIEVVGIAETYVEPDEVTFQVILQTTDKSSLLDAEKKFFEILQKNNIYKDDLDFKALNNYNNYWYNWWNSKNFFRKIYLIKINPKTNVLNFAEDLNQKWVSDFSIVKINNTKFADFRKETKIKAMKMAKEKADYLLESIGAKAGKPIEINEIEEPESDTNILLGYNRNKMMSNTSYKIEMNEGSQIQNIEPIKLRYTIKAKFLIQ